MKLITPLYAALILALSAQEPLPSAREDLINALMEARDEKSFSAAYLAGSKAGIPEQTLIEARFLYLVDEADQAALAAYAPVLQKQLAKFSVDDSTIFSVKEDFQSIVEYTLALDALQKNKEELFKKHITEAFWLSPAQAGLFEPLITEARLKKAMQKITLDLGEPFENQEKPNTTTTFKSIAGEAPAFLLHFWTPWVQHSIEGMAAYSLTAKTLTDHGIPPVSVLLTGTSDSRKDADDFLASTRGSIPGHWVIDRDKRSLVSLFRIQNFPIVALISREGKVLFNGNPGDPVLWAELRKLNPAIKQPKIELPLPDLENIEGNLPDDGDSE
ncbi:hypothetical protein V2O64_22220 [Verrucomicrobiaceae bacterium 227]